VARKLYLEITVDNDLSLEALIDAGADITLMSAQLLSLMSLQDSVLKLRAKIELLYLNHVS